MDNLPNWNGAREVYGKALRILEDMARNGGVRIEYKRGKPFRCTPNEDMCDLIDALNKGDEERIKGLLAMTHIYHIKGFV